MSPANYNPSRVIYAVGLKAVPFVVRYVGLTRGTALDRLKLHVSNARKGRISAFYSWMRKYLDQEFEIIVLEECSTLSDYDLGQRERYWISHFRALHGNIDSCEPSKLLNMSDGGINCSLSGDANPKSMLGKTHSESTKQKISESNKGRTFSDAHREKLSESAKRREISQDIRDKISKTKQGSVPWNKGLRKEKPVATISSKPMHVRWHENRNIIKDGCIFCDN